MLEDFCEQPKCAVCGKEAMNRCSRCKHEWYCSRDCQLRGWKPHKEMCAVLTRGREREEQNAKEAKEAEKKR